jgi:crotonobetainyl-CoA:carnitine CoA-transferase CaiB-like acyl-CoA transferase
MAGVSEARAPDSVGRPHDQAQPPLAGVRVLDFTHVLAGPFCTRLLADLGAEVVRVESSKHPDSPWKSVIDPASDRDYSYLVVSRNKQSVALNLKTDAGRELAARLAGVADVLVENFSAGVMARLELDYPRLSAANPGLIYVSMSGYGHEGPRRDWTSMNTNLQAYSGLMMVTGAEGEPPIAISNSWMDYIGGLHACFAILEALAQRERSGRGAHLDLSQFECGVATIGPALLASAASGTAPARLGNRSTSAAPQGCYPCAGQDAWCVISVQDNQQWRAFAEVVGRPEWARERRFATLVGRLRHHDELDASIAEWTRQLPAVEVELRLQDAGVPAERMRRINEVVNVPDSSGVFSPADGQRTPFVLMTGMPFALHPTPLAEARAAPRLGEDTDRALASWLGLQDDAIARLRQEGVLA